MSLLRKPEVGKSVIVTTTDGAQMVEGTAITPGQADAIRAIEAQRDQCWRMAVDMRELLQTTLLFMEAFADDEHPDSWDAVETIRATLAKKPSDF